MKKFVVVAALGLFALFVALPAPASARHGGRYHSRRHHAFVGGWRGYNAYCWARSPHFFHRPWRAGYYYPYAGASYYYPYPVFDSNAGASYVSSYTAYYPQVPAVDENTVTIQMHVPSDARVWFDGEATSQSGADRTFVTPSLAPGREYVYHIRVQWNENGKAMERNRDATVHAGDRINLSIDK
jgi:uncharacterized protein (TIGR03000 family)